MSKGSEQMTQKGKRRRRKHFLETDYDIPKFNFKQAFLLMGLLAGTFLIGALIIETVASQFVLLVMLLIAILAGFIISMIQFYKKEAAKKAKVTVGILFSILAFIMLFAFYYSDILI